MPPEFSLQPVLDYRHSRVEAEQIELARLQQAYHQGLAHLDFLEEEISLTYHQIGKMQTGNIDMDQLAQFRLRVRTLDQQIKDQKETLTTLLKQIEAQRERLVLAKQEEETLVILKKKRLETWKAEERRKETAQRDDIYIAQAFQRSVLSARD